MWPMRLTSSWSISMRNWSSELAIAVGRSLSSRDLQGWSYSIASPSSYFWYKLRKMAKRLRRRSYKSYAVTSMVSSRWGYIRSPVILVVKSSTLTVENWHIRVWWSVSSMTKINFAKQLVYSIAKLKLYYKLTRTVLELIGGTSKTLPSSNSWSGNYQSLQLSYLFASFALSFGILFWALSRLLLPWIYKNLWLCKHSNWCLKSSSLECRRAEHLQMPWLTVW